MDLERVIRECRRACVERRQISNACARMIAVTHCNGKGSLSATLARTGAILAPPVALCLEMFGPPHLIRGRDGLLAYTMMRGYLASRYNIRRVAAVPGWASLWIRSDAPVREWSLPYRIGQVTDSDPGLVGPTCSRCAAFQVDRHIRSDACTPLRDELGRLFISPAASMYRFEAAYARFACIKGHHGGVNRFHPTRTREARSTS